MDNQPVKIEMTRTETFDIEVTFPVYRRLPSGQYYYACLDKDTVILVNTDTPEIAKSYLNQAYLFKNAYDTTKEDFEAAYNKTLTKLTELFTK